MLRTVALILFISTVPAKAGKRDLMAQTNTVLQINSARFGDHENSDAKTTPKGITITPQLRVFCNGRLSCTVLCNSVKFGDPSPGKPKFCDVAYTCGGVDQPAASFLENAPIVIGCQ